MDELAQDVTIAPEFFVPFSSYKPDAEFSSVAAPLLPLDWRMRPDYFWTYVTGPKPSEVIQGWKIHVSSTHEAAVRILSKVIPICVAQSIDFKFASDRFVLKKLLAKNAARSAGGKFITIYPPTEAKFRELLELLYCALSGESGPYILSDRAYKDSEVVFYRYGGFKSFTHVDLMGRSTSNIINADFSYIEDLRGAKYHLPEFVRDPFEDDEPGLETEAKAGTEAETGAPDDEPAAPASVLLHERFQCLESLKFSNAGGVYRALDTVTGMQVIIKEARPHIAQDRHGKDAIYRLIKEFRILDTIRDLRIAPQPVLYFQEWNHFYFAQEFIPGQSLRKFFMGSNRLLHPGTSAEKMTNWFRKSVDMGATIVELVHRLHKRNVVFGDLSLHNVMVDPETMRPMLIDFEAAFVADVDSPVNMWTPGFGSPARRARECVNFADDYYALGALLFSIVAPEPALQDVKPAYAAELLADVRKNFGIPLAYEQLVLTLLSQTHVDLDKAVDVLRSLSTCEIRAFDQTPPPGPDCRAYCADTARRLLDYTASRLDFAEPAAGLPFGQGFRQILSIDFGVLGPAYAWQQVTGDVPADFAKWLKNKVHYDGQLPGLMNGLSGLAWVAADLGWEEVAANALANAARHRYLFQHGSLAYGTSGYGLANLRAWTRTGGARYKDEALRMGEVLCAGAVHVGATCYWPSAIDTLGQPVGLYEGGSGIALYLLYLYCAFGDARYLELGEKALAYDLNAQGKVDDVVGYPRQINPSIRILYPYMAYGSAGVGSVAIRYLKVTNNAKYRQVVDDIIGGASQKYSIAPGMATGLCGLGTFLKDAADLLGIEPCHALVQRIVDGLRLFEIEQERGCAVAGVRPSKISVDYMNGSSGVALFMHWVATGKGHPNFMMMDELLPSGGPR